MPMEIFGNHCNEIGVRIKERSYLGKDLREVRESDQQIW